MAAATGYGAPTDQQLAAYADLPKWARYGHEMAEVGRSHAMAEAFAVRVPGAAAGGGRKPPPRGTISFHGGNCCSSVIYSWSLPDQPTSTPPCDGEGNLVLTGPSVVISTYGPMYFRLQLHDGTQQVKDGEEDSAKLQFDANDGYFGGFSNYDRVRVGTVDTPCGPADVTYAVLSNGVEGRVAVVKLACPDGEAPTGVLGRIVARSELFDAGCVLFHNEDNKGVSMVSGELLPLARHVVAVPMHVPLTVELDLSCYSGDEIVRDALVFNPAFGGQHMERVMGAGGAVAPIPSLLKYESNPCLYCHINKCCLA